MIRFALALGLALGSVASAQPRSAGLDAFEAGRRAFEANNYEAAIGDFQRAYQLDADPGYLFNLAQAQRLAGHCAEAAASYRKFLVLVPQPPNYDRVQDWIAAADVCTRERATAYPSAAPLPPVLAQPAPPPAIAITATPRPRPSPLPAYLAAGVGVVGIGLAAYFTWDVGHLASEREALCSGTPPCEWTAAKTATAADLATRGSHASDAAIASWTIGGLAIAAAAAYYAYVHTRGDEPVVTVAPTPHGAVAGLVLAF
jgi:tetratricopeptide (TPR) repeat protein